MEEENKEERIDSFIKQKLVDKNNTKWYALILALTAFILRLIAANNLGLNADDANHATIALGSMESGKLVIYGQASILWYHIQETFYNILGTSMLDSRMASAIFGSLFVIVMFLFVKRVFKSEKAGLIAAFLAAFSPFLIKMTLPEMDMAAVCFIMTSALFLFEFIFGMKARHIILSSIFIGIGIMIKVYALLFAFSFLIFLLYSFYKKRALRKSIKPAIIFLAIIFICSAPTLAHNYLLYKDKGFMDIFFVNIFGIGREKAEAVYGSLLTMLKGPDYPGFFFGRDGALPGFLTAFSFLLYGDPIVFICGLLGFLLLFRKRSEYIIFFLIVFLPPFIYIGSQSAYLMHKHFTFMPALFIPLAAGFIDSLAEKFKIRLRYLLILIIVLNLLLLGGTFGKTAFYSESADSKMIEYKINNIEKDSLVVIDSRIYRGYISWMFHDRNYLEFSLFGKALEESKKYDSAQPIPTYIIECVSDDCGWGTIANQPEFNQTIESMVQYFANNSQVSSEMNEINREKYYFPIISNGREYPVYRVYKTTLMLSPSILTLAKSTHVANLYPIGYDKSVAPIFDDFEIHSSMDKAAYYFSASILKAAKWLSLITIIYLIWLLFRDK